jgi:hypothetical protein
MEGRDRERITRVEKLERGEIGEEIVARKKEKRYWEGKDRAEEIEKDKMWKGMR